VTLKANHTPWDDALARVDPARFEALLADYYRGCGWLVEQVGADFTGQRYDGGFDLKLRRDDAYVIVQCKRWKAFQVPQHEVHELHAIMANEAATGAIYVTSGEFTAAAIAAAVRIGHVELVDGGMLRTMLDPVALESAARDGAPPMYAHPQLTLSVGPRQAPAAPRRGLLVPVLTIAACVVVCAGVVHSLNAMVRPAPRVTATRGAQIPPRPDEPHARPGAQADPYSLAGQGIPTLPAIADIPSAGRPAVAGAPSPRARARSIDREAARAAVRPLAGVRNVFWLDDNDLVVVVDRGHASPDPMIDTVCGVLAPLGDSAAVIVDLQQATSRKASEPILSRACAASMSTAVPTAVAGSTAGSDRRAR